MTLRIAILVLLLLFSAVARAQPRLNLDDRDHRVVLIGSGLVEQERRTGYLEARLVRHGLDHAITCRNLGWSGDSVLGDARPSGFQNPAGVNRLVKDASELKPTVIIVGYGFVESFEGEAGLAKFSQGYEALLDRLEKLTPSLVLLSPAIQEGDAQRNADLERYTAAISNVANKRNLPFVDLFHPLAEFKRAHPDQSLTSNGITLNECGYWLVGDEVERQLHLNDGGAWTADVTAEGKLVSAEGATVSAKADQGTLAVHLTERSLPLSPSPCRGVAAGTDGRLKVENLPAGEWTLKADGKEVASGDEKQWAAGMTIALESDRHLAEELRGTIVGTEAQFYRRSRPFNDHPRHFTYIDKDYPLYDGLLAEQDKALAALRHPVVHEFEIFRKGTPKP